MGTHLDAKKRWAIYGLVAAGLLVAVVLLPVAVAQLLPPAPRKMSAVTLDEVDYREVHFRNQSQGIDLAGMLFVPVGEGPFPAAVIIQGSGSSRRSNGWYLTLADYLQQRGIAVLLPDKRGSEQSGGDWRGASFEDLASDTAAAVDFLREQPHVEVSSVSLVGMSQGGHIVPLAASQSTGVACVVNVVGSAVPLRDGLVYEEVHNLREIGFLPGVADLIARLSSTYIIHVGQREFWQAVGDYDPLPYWQQLELPALVLYGELDTNVDTATSVARLQGIGKPNIEIVVYPGSGHALEDPPGQGDRILRSDALERTARFIESAAQGR